MMLFALMKIAEKVVWSSIELHVWDWRILGKFSKNVVLFDLFFFVCDRIFSQQFLVSLLLVMAVVVHRCVRNCTYVSNSSIR